MGNKILDINSKRGGASDHANYVNFKFGLSDFKPLRKPALNISKVFTGMEVEKIPAYLIKTYKLSGIEFGNWVNQVRRIDFCLNTAVGLYDLQKILKFKNNNIGLNNKVGIAFGARGYAKAYAHFEPLTNVINMTRDRRADKITDLFGNKMSYEVNTPDYKAILNELRKDNSGYGSLAHEYGHALDYILAGDLKREKALSGGSALITSPTKISFAYKHFTEAVYKIQSSYKTSLIEGLFIDCFEAFLFNKEKPTSFYKRLYKYAEKKSDYWIRLNEIWARVFETYIAYKLFKLGVKDDVLVREGKGKYRSELKGAAKYVYPSFGEMATHYKKIDRFLEAVAKKY